MLSPQTIPQMILFTFLGSVYVGLAFWNVLLSGKVSKRDLTIEEKDLLIFDLQKEVSIKTAEVLLAETAKEELAKSMLEMAKTNKTLHADNQHLLSENDSLRDDIQFTKSENERFLADLTKVVTKLPKHDPTTGRFVKRRKI